MQQRHEAEQEKMPIMTTEEELAVVEDENQPLPLEKQFFGIRMVYALLRGCNWLILKLTANHLYDVFGDKQEDKQ